LKKRQEGRTGGKGTRERKKIQLKIALVCEKETQERVRVEKAISV